MKNNFNFHVVTHLALSLEQRVLSSLDLEGVFQTYDT